METNIEHTTIERVGVIAITRTVDFEAEAEARGGSLNVEELASVGTYTVVFRPSKKGVKPLRFPHDTLAECRDFKKGFCAAHDARRKKATSTPKKKNTKKPAKSKAETKAAAAAAKAEAAREEGVTKTN